MATSAILESRCKKVRGEWVRGSFLDTAKPTRRTWAEITYLAERFHDINQANWYLWVEDHCPDLPQCVNGGKIHSVEVPTPKGYGWVRIWLLEDAEAIHKRRSEPGARRTDPDGWGEWTDENTFELARDMGPNDPPHATGLRAGDRLFKDKHLAQKLMRVSPAAVSASRRHRRKALDPSVNGGRLRYLHVCDNSDGPRPKMVYVESQKDAKKLIESRAASRGARPPAGLSPGATLRDLATDLGINPKDQASCRKLETVLCEFRRQFPAAAWKEERWDEERNRPCTDTYHDRAAFRRWLGPRTIAKAFSEVMCAVRERRNTGSGRPLRRRLQTAIAFWQFVLTRGRYSTRLFKRFRANPPYGETLTPCGPVPSADIEQWAQSARISPHALKAAKKELPIKSAQLAFHGPWHCRLTAPVTISRPTDTCDGDGQAVRSHDVPAAPQAESPAPKRRGPKTRESTRLFAAFCYVELRLKMKYKRPRIYKDACERYHRKYTPGRDNTAATYASRFSIENNLPAKPEGAERLRLLALHERGELACTRGL